MAGIELTPGAVLGPERYTLRRRLGAGGMASVWLADDVRLDREVAVKVMADRLAGDERYRQRFAREARAAASVSHANIVPVYDYGLEDGHPFLVMEYVTGGNLADVFAGQGVVVPEPAALAGELLSALDCVHAAGLVHRDIKPANILLDRSGRARLTDFGIAQPEDATSLTQTGMVIGTLRYLAPEVVAGGRASPAADLYAAGVVLAELAARAPAPALAALVSALTAADPADRPSSAAAALRLLDTAPTEVVAGTAPTEVVAGTAATEIISAAAPAPFVPAPAPPPTPPPARRPPPAHGRTVSPRTAAWAAAAAAALVVVVLLLVTASGSPSGGRAASPPPAAAGAPLADQISSLRRLVEHAAKPTG